MTVVIHTRWQFYLIVVVKDATLTQESLISRGIHVSKIFFSCEQQEETINRLFLDCRVGRQLWNLFASFRGIRWTMSERAGQALES